MSQSETLYTAGPVDHTLAIRQILFELRGTDAAGTEAALEKAERQLAALMVHDGPAAQ